MEISTKQLKKKLAQRNQELEGKLTERLWWAFQNVLEDDFFRDDEEKIHIYDFVVRVILRTDKTPAEHIASLMTLVSPESGDFLDKMDISHSAGFVRDYLKKEKIQVILEGKKKKKGIWR